MGDGEAQSRWFSRAGCGIVTILAASAIGLRLGGLRGCLWTLYLAGCSPLLVEYDREARMYAMLTMLATLAWWNLLRFRDRSSRGRYVLQVVL